MSINLQSLSFSDHAFRLKFTRDLHWAIYIDADSKALKSGIKHAILVFMLGK